MKKLDWLICACLLLSPIAVNYIVRLTATTSYYDGWLGYYGTLVGALVTMFVLYRTRRWNRDDNDKTRRMQTKMLEYQAKTVWFENFRKQLDENYRILNFQDTVTIVNEITAGNLMKAMCSLMELNKNIEMQGYTFDLYLPSTDLSEEEKEYVDCYNRVLKMYGTYVNDLIIICTLRQIVQSQLSVVDYLNNTLSQVRALNGVNENVEPSQFLLDLVKKVESNCPYAEIGDMCTSRVNDTSIIHSNKTDLAKVTKVLLKSEEQKLQELLMI